MASKTRAADKSFRTPITYRRQTAWATLVKRRLALARACAEATATGTKPAEARRRTLMEQVRELDARRRTGRVPRQLPRGVHLGPAQPLPLIYTRTASVAPDAVYIGLWAETENGVFNPSDLIYPCPDDGTGHYWSAWFADGRVTVERWGKLEIAGDNFTGRIWASLDATAQGVACIESGGSVGLGSECWVGVYRKVDGESGYRLIGSAGNNWGADAFYSLTWTHTPGIVSLNVAYEQQQLELTDARPGDLVYTRQILLVSACLAEVQLGPNRSDCAAGGRHGFLETPPPTVTLQYARFSRHDVVQLPHGIP
jgi:hypothetical protein